MKYPLSKIREVVAREIDSNPDTPDHTMVDQILSDQLSLMVLEGVEAHKFQDPNTQVVLPPELLEKYDQIYTECNRDHNFPWYLKKVVIEKMHYFLGYVLDVGVSSNRDDSLFERVIWLYPVEDIEIDINVAITDL